MGQAVPVRADYTASEVRRFARRAKDGAQAPKASGACGCARRASREEAAKIGGMEGPLAVVQGHRMDAAFRTALNLAAVEGAAQVSAFLPGVSEAVGIAVEHRMRITFPMVLSSTRDFGDR
jgi:hypothetical protein